MKPDSEGALAGCGASNGHPMFFSFLRGRERLSFLESFSFILVALSVAMKLACIIVVRWQHIDTGYIGTDHPEYWDILRPHVRLASDTTRRFSLVNPEGIAQWRSLIPGDGLIHLGPSREPYMVSMIHQLRCLDIMREEIVASTNRTGPPSRLSRHCMNYMRHMVLCRSVAQLEYFEVTQEIAPVDLHGVYECRDWGAVYTAVEENQMEYGKWTDNGL